MTHEQLISACFTWHWNTFPEERRMLYAVNNNISEGILSYVPAYKKTHVARMEGAKNKAKGVVAGVWDFCYLPVSGGCVYMDAKVGQDKLSEEQIDFKDKCHSRGIICEVFSSLKQFQELIIKYNGR